MSQLSMHVQGLWLVGELASASHNTVSILCACCFARAWALAACCGGHQESISHALLCAGVCRKILVRAFSGPQVVCA